jgi:hypothetical protein
VAPTTIATGTAAPTADGSAPIWPWILVAVVAVAVVAAYVARSNAMERAAPTGAQRPDDGGDEDTIP